MSVRLGPNYDRQRDELSFRVYSKNASRIQIHFYSSPLGSDEVLVKTLAVKDGIWGLVLPLDTVKDAGIVTDYVYYGYRAWGPNWEYSDEWRKGSNIGFKCDVDGAGNRFNPNKLLIDPYARELSHDPQVARLHMDPNAYVSDYYGGDYRNIDTGRIAPKSICLLKNETPDCWDKPKRHLKDDIIYEVNLRGFSMLDDKIPPNERGTFKGAAKKAAYLKELGVTAVEFLPVQEFADEQNDDGDPRGDNYWGYMTLNYFSPNRRYSSDKSPGGPTREFRDMVKSFHSEGIKVFLDVVYNHTGEGILMRKVDQENPRSREDVENAIRDANPSRGSDLLQDADAACIMSYAGLDNQSYYFLRDGNRRYEGRGGCGGNLNYDNEVVRNLILDSLKYWVDEMGVDGFRFDLAPILSVTGSDGSYRSNENTDIFSIISNSLPSRSVSFSNGVDLIAEPWGEGSDINWTAGFPGDWSVWNMAFRDTIKTSLNRYGSVPLRIGEISKVLSGSEEIIRKKPWNSINYIVSHDDCNSLLNLFSFNAFFHLDEAVVKYDQISWDMDGSMEMRKKAVRNAFALLMLSAGVPMFAGGDELFRSIPPYEDGIGKMNLVSVDSPEVYLDFSGYNRMKDSLEAGNYQEFRHLAENSDVLETYLFVRNLIHFRNKHECLRPFDYFTGTVDPRNGLKDIAWHRDDGNETAGADWDTDDFISYRINAGFENVHDPGDRVGSIYVAYNRSPFDKYVILPQNLHKKRWHRIFDTNDSSVKFAGPGEFNSNGVLSENKYLLLERSVLLLAER